MSLVKRLLRKAEEAWEKLNERRKGRKRRLVKKKRLKNNKPVRRKVRYEG